jgi:cytochrome oxidase Cu insertion factor (SCO1/SenC/PrrC family)
LLVVVVALAVLAGLLFPRAASTETDQSSALAGTVLTSTPAPGFRLRDQFGREVSLAGFRGRPVVLSFMGATCTQLCPVAAETLRRTAAELGPAGKKVAFVVISTDPEDDTHAAVVRFSRRHGMLNRWHYLVGTRAQLGPIWRAYHLYVAPANAPAQIKAAHTSATYLIDGAGRERVLMTENPDGVGLDRDLRILLGLPATSAAQEALPAPQPGHPAPALALPRLTGGTLNLTSFRGHVVLLNFWATWCTPCRTEMPMLERWYSSLRKQGFVVVGVDQQEGRSDVAPFIRKLHVDYPVVFDEDGVASARFNVAGLPTTLVIDRNGIVRTFKPGILDVGFLAGSVRPVIAAGAVR